VINGLLQPGESRRRHRDAVQHEDVGEQLQLQPRQRHGPKPKRVDKMTGDAKDAPAPAKAAAKKK